VNSDNSAEFVQLSGVEVHRDQVEPEAVGIDDHDVRTAVEKTVRDGFGESLPESGWRVLNSTNDVVNVGACDDDTWQGWATIMLRRVDGIWMPHNSGFAAHDCDVGSLSAPSWVTNVTVAACMADRQDVEASARPVNS
jgi:hypothetical protein